MRKTFIISGGVLTGALLLLGMLFLPEAHSQSAAKNEAYFPTNITGSWYSDCLRAMDEPSLFARPTNSIAETYRFLLIPSFEDPIMVRIERTGRKVPCIWSAWHALWTV